MTCFVSESGYKDFCCSSFRVCLIVLTLLCPAVEVSQAQTTKFLSNIKQLTFGGQNAEAYWSPDGKRLVFQATRDGNDCDQIYVMNADGSDLRMVSTGKGVTTCGYFLPSGHDILYSSTHESSEMCPVPTDRSQGYVWPIHAGYDIYRVKLDGTDLRRLTHREGYDAEGTVNWTDEKIVYTSTAAGDLDLWSMDLEGREKTRLTTALGYDGGGFFSPDGEKLVWRAHHPKGADSVRRYLNLFERDLTAPMKMELFIADANGSNSRKITEFGCASFAPQFTPNQKNIIFSSNMGNCDSREFELFMVDVDGGNMTQITDFGGFTSFAEFSPNGLKIVFTSSHNARSPYEFNIFTADWHPPKSERDPRQSGR
ncbi:MAG: hypothetical protein CMN58_00320 [Solibacterales bacterium]|nr:hypothetical protein [Bryobacterales bacterium]|tara:strand:- start:8810 stop:9916 length:1107 start_codon:yes stop_codon:yes gene_type:complete